MNERGKGLLSKITKENPKLEVITSVKKFLDSSKDKATKQLLEEQQMYIHLHIKKLHLLIWIIQTI